MTNQETAEIDATIKTSERGYAIGVSCSNGPHSGNRGLRNGQLGYWSCMGCGNHVASADVLRRQREAEAQELGDDDPRVSTHVEREEAMIRRLDRRETW